MRQLSCTVLLLAAASMADAEERAETPAVATWHLRGKTALPRRHGFLRSIAFSPDGKYLAAACGGNEPDDAFHAPLRGAVYLVETTTAEPARLIKTEFIGTPDAVGFSADCRTVVACWGHGMVSWWNVKTGKLEGRLKGTGEPTYTAALTPDAVLAAWSCRDGKVRVWDLAAGKPRVAVEAGVFHRSAFAANGKLLAVTTREIPNGKFGSYLAMKEQPVVMILDVERGNVEVTLKDCGDAPVALSARGDMLATEGGKGSEGIVTLWHLPGGRSAGELRAHSSGISGLAFSPDGKLLATGAVFNPKAKVWNVRSGTLLTVLPWTDREEPTSFHVPLAFTADGKILAVAAEEGAIAFWDVPDAPDAGREGPARRNLGKGHERRIP